MSITDVDDVLSVRGQAYVKSKAFGTLMASFVELSFWGGVNPQTGEIIDRHHDLSGRFLQDHVLAIPSGRGSCSGSGVLLEVLLNDKGPKAILFERREDILTLGVMITEELFNKAIPVVTLGSENFRKLFKFNGQKVFVDGPLVSNQEQVEDIKSGLAPSHEDELSSLGGELNLSDLDRALLEGSHGEAARVAIRIVLRMADLLGATELMDITQVHIDACVYTGLGSLALAQRLRDWGGKVRVPTSMNSISIDQRRWRAQGVDVEFGSAANELAKAYTDMGAQPTFTCAPYQLQTAPKRGEQVAWGESNAVVYANSVLGARTMKYPDFLDIAIALTGRAPNGGPHVDDNRLASVVVRLIDLETCGPEAIDDSFYPLLGYHVGAIATSQIPVVTGMESLVPCKDDLKAFGAAFATVSGAPMFHIVGVTPEATSLEAVIAATDVRTVDVRLKDLSICWDKLNSPVRNKSIDLISLGNPHFSVSELRKLAELCRGRKKAKDVSVIVTCGRATYSLATQAGFVGELEEFGVLIMTDTCWCMITDPVIHPSTKVIMTNSGKYAHYGPGLTGRDFYFGSLRGCVDVACGSIVEEAKPRWIDGVPR